MSLDSGGAEYLLRLRKQESPELKRGIAEQPEETASAASQPAAPAPGERRRSPRYKCEGSAEFRVESSDVRTWGTFTDISVTGCYVEMTATFPVGARVDLGLELNGIRAQMQGEVRVSYPYLGMGIAFTDISNQNRGRLRDMIDSIAPSTRAPAAAPAVPAILALPLVVNPAAALQAVAEFFEKHGLLTKEEFVGLLRRSQGV